MDFGKGLSYLLGDEADFGQCLDWAIAHNDIIQQSADHADEIGVR